MKQLTIVLLLTAFAVSQTVQINQGAQTSRTGARVTTGEVMAKDLSNWGVKADGEIVGAGCAGNNGDTSIGCWGAPVFNMYPSLTQAHKGKLVILYGAGPITGRVYQDGNWQVVSGGSGGTDGLQPITFTDPTDGCSLNAGGQPDYTSMPYAWVNVVNGVATGQLWSNPAFYGDHCTHPPTQGTVATVTGTVTFSGGAMEYGDLPTTVTSVESDYQFHVADPIISPYYHGQALVGSDDHDAFEAACADHTAGHLTFTGILMVSRGVTCGNPTLWLEGAGYYPMSATSPGTPFPGSIMVYAGKGTEPTPGSEHPWILEFGNGVGAKIWRMSFKGNSMARPYALMPSFGRPGVSGGGNGAMYDYSQLWIGWEWGDAESETYQLQSCIFSNAVPGNGDFHTLDQIYCYGSEVGLDGVNNQAVNWKIGKWQSEMNNIGVACFGSPEFTDYYTEYNRLDIMGGSPTHPGAPCVYLKMGYGGESSAKEFENSPLWNWGYYDIDPNGFGLASPEGWINPQPTCFSWGCINAPTMVDLHNVGYARWNGGVPPGTYIKLTHGCAGGPTYEINSPPSQQAWDSYDVLACSNLSGPAFKNTYTQTDMVSDWLTPDNVAPLPSAYVADKLYPLMRKDEFFLNTTGSILVTTPRPPGQSEGYWDYANYLGIAPDGFRSITANIDATQTTIPLNPVASQAQVGYVATVIRIGDEFITVVCDDWSNPSCYDTWNPLVLRGGGGTTAVSHSAGDLVTLVSTDERGKNLHSTFVGFLRSAISPTDTQIHLGWVRNGDDIGMYDPVTYQIEHMTVVDNTDNMNPVVTRGAHGTTAVAHYANWAAWRVDGNTTYTYEVTCSDPQGKETAVGKTYNGTLFTLNLPDRPAILTKAFANLVFWWPMRGCAYYNLYGNQGSGPIGFLKSTSSIDLGGYNYINYPNQTFMDQGDWTVNPARTPPATSQSGTVEAEGGFISGGHSGVTTTLTIANCTLTITGGIITGHSGTDCP